MFFVSRKLNVLPQDEGVDINLLDGDDAGGGDIFVDPRDPGKWVQQEDTVFRDGVFFALVVTILWTFAKALVEIEKLNF